LETIEANGMAVGLVALSETEMEGVVTEVPVVVGFVVTPVVVPAAGGAEVVVVPVDETGTLVVPDG
jgi:hypothetical protein